jgi:hypothetical protein
MNELSLLVKLEGFGEEVVLSYFKMLYLNYFG